MGTVLDTLVAAAECAGLRVTGLVLGDDSTVVSVSLATAGPAARSKTVRALEQAVKDLLRASGSRRAAGSFGYRACCHGAALEDVVTVRVHGPPGATTPHDDTAWQEAVEAAVVVTRGTVDAGTRWLVSR